VARSFRDLITRKWNEDKFFCLPLDSDYDRISPAIRNFVAGIGGPVKDILFRFNKLVVDETASLVCAYMFNLGIYTAYARNGAIEALMNSIDYVRTTQPDIPVILDAPLALSDPAANELLAHTAFTEFNVDALTVNPLLGLKALKPLIDRNFKGIIVACYSGQDAGREMLDLPVTPPRQKVEELLNGPARALGRDITDFPESIPFYQYLAHRVANHWNISENCWLGFEAGRPEEIERTRRIADELPFLIKVREKKDLRQLVKAALDRRKRGFVVTVPEVLFFGSQTDFRNRIVMEIQRINRIIMDARDE
jgi:orotidine-5'-phosphate decarboxylase